MRTFLAAGACAVLAFLGMSVYLVMTNSAPSSETAPAEELSVSTAPPAKSKRTPASSEPTRVALSPIPIPIDDSDSPPLPVPRPAKPAPGVKPVHQPAPSTQAIEDQPPPKPKRPPLPDDEDDPPPPPAKIKRPRPPLPEDNDDPPPSLPKRPRPPLPEDNESPPARPKAKSPPPAWMEDDEDPPARKPAPRPKSVTNPPTSANPANPRPMNPRPAFVYSPTMFYTMTAGSRPSPIPTQVTIYNTPLGRLNIQLDNNPSMAGTQFLARGSVVSGVKKSTWEVRLVSGKVVVEFDGLRVRPR